MILSTFAPSFQKWIQDAANALNPLLSGYPYPMLDTAPSNVRAGYTYYDTTTNKVRTFDGTTFNDHW